MKTNPTIRGTTPEVRANAKVLRANLTPAERRLWAALRGRQLGGLKFRCQHPVGPFVLDFWCPERKLAVEVDGDVHDGLEQAEYDAARTAQLAAFGYRVVRVRNEEVFEDLATVLARIAAACASLPDPTGAPTPQLAPTLSPSPKSATTLSPSPKIGGGKGGGEGEAKGGVRAK